MLPIISLPACFYLRFRIEIEVDASRFVVECEWSIERLAGAFRGETLDSRAVPLGKQRGHHLLRELLAAYRAEHAEPAAACELVGSVRLLLVLVGLALCAFVA